jgi:hypothetical protein
MVLQLKTLRLEKNSACYWPGIGYVPVRLLDSITFQGVVNLQLNPSFSDDLKPGSREQLQEKLVRSRDNQNITWKTNCL